MNSIICHLCISTVILLKTLPNKQFYNMIVKDFPNLGIVGNGVAMNSRNLGNNEEEIYIETSLTGLLVSIVALPAQL